MDQITEQGVGKPTDPVATTAKFDKRRPAILLCAGPTDPWVWDVVKEARASGLCVAALNHATEIMEADLWMSVDAPAAFLESSVSNATQRWVRAAHFARYSKKWPETYSVQYGCPEGDEAHRTFCDGRLPVPRFIHKGLLWATQLLVVMGWKTVLIVGSPMTFPKQGIYAFDGVKGDKRRPHQAEMYQQVWTFMRDRGVREAEKNGIRLVNCHHTGRLRDAGMETMTLPAAIALYDPVKWATPVPAPATEPVEAAEGAEAAGERGAADGV